MQQLDLESAFKARSGQAEASAPDPQEEIDRLLKAQNELAAKKEALRQLEERKESIVTARKDTLYRLKRSLESLDKEQGYMKDEYNVLDQIKECFAKHVKDLEYLDPDSWERPHLDSYMDKTEALVENAENDFAEAVAHCVQRMSRTKMFSDMKVGKNSFLGANLRDVFVQGMIYNLPLLILGIVALIVFIIK